MNVHQLSKGQMLIFKMADTRIDPIVINELLRLRYRQQQFTKRSKHPLYAV